MTQRARQSSNAAESNTDESTAASGSGSSSKKADKPWRVVNAQDRTVFSGSERDVREHVQRNFPRVHAEPGTDYGDEGPTPDVFVVSPDGKYSAYSGPEMRDDAWVDYKDGS